MYNNPPNNSVFLVIVVLLLSCSVVYAQPNVIAPSDPVPIGGFADVELRGMVNPESLSFEVIPDTPVRVYSVWGSDDPIIAIPTNKKGTWFIIVAAIEDNAANKVWMHKVKLVIGDAAPDPQPVPPNPPGPDPPPPGPSGLRVLILRETSENTSREHLVVLNSPQVRQYLKSKADDRWRIWDDDYTENQLEHVEQHWRDAYEQAKRLSNGVRPWIHITNGVEGASVSLPDSVEDTLTLLKEYGG